MSLEAMAKRCPKSKDLGKTNLAHYELFFAGDQEGYLSIRPKQGSYVPLVLWEITPECEEALDDYEAYPKLYTKETVSVEFQGESVEVMVYIMAPPYSSQAMQTTEKYVQVVHDGYQDFEIDFSPIEAALKEVTSIVEE